MFQLHDLLAERPEEGGQLQELPRNVQEVIGSRHSIGRDDRNAGRPGFTVETTEGNLDARFVVAATGPFQQPVVPPVIPGNAGVEQLHSASYRNPGQLPAGGRTFDVQSYCYRHEPSDDPARMQIFRMHEYVRVGFPEEVQGFRDMWLERSQVLMRAMGLDVRAVIAHDPFFGRGGKMLAETQRDQSLKFELVVPITSEEKPTAIVSCNYHQDHFGELFGIRSAGAAAAHTSCVGFGLERIALALFRRHGFDRARWPATVRGALQL